VIDMQQAHLFPMYAAEEGSLSVFRLIYDYLAFILLSIHVSDNPAFPQISRQSGIFTNQENTV